MITSVCDTKWINLPKISDPRGHLTFLESGNHVPFDIKRLFYLYGIGLGEKRGAHAHKNLHQLIIATSGKFDLVVDDGLNKLRFSLNNPYSAIYVPPMLWGDLESFSSDAVCMVVASDVYVESDYIRDYQEYLEAKGVK